MATKKKNNKKNGTLFTIACCVLALLVMLIAFLVKKDQIITNLKETAFFERVFGTTPEFVQNHEVKPKEKEETLVLNETPLTIVIENEKQNTNTIKEDEEKDVAEVRPVKESVEETAETQKKEEIKKDNTKKEEKAVKATSEVSLCFVVIDGDGSVSRKIVKRTVPKNDSPLVTAINELLKGPDTTKTAEKNCITVIPDGTKLLSAKVQNNVAYLSFNDKFEINRVGVEGSLNQLMQVVYTATAFSTVNSVQFIIEGQQLEYLGPEGVWIGTPLSKNSFN